MYPGIPIKQFSGRVLSLNKVLWATGIALLVHIVGLMGILWINRQWFAAMTPVNLLLMFALIIWTQEEKKRNFFIFLMIAFLLGMLFEITGVQTGILFGHYSYGSIMGIQVAGVPLIIGLNWFVVIYSAVATVYFFIQLIESVSPQSMKNRTACNPLSINILAGGVFLTTFFDWIMEPVAVDLGFWTWAGNGQIPLLNYISWFLVSTFLLSIFRFLKIRPDNLFGVHLFLIQLMFFIILRVFL